MKIFKIIIFVLLILFLICLGILTFTKNELTVAKAEFNENYQNIYPPNCFVNFENKKYLIQEKYKYRYKILSEYWFIGSEGFAVQKFEFPFEMNYNNEQKKYRILKYNENKKNVDFNSQEYEITERRSDTIISKIDDDKIILFIDE